MKQGKRVVASSNHSKIFLIHKTNCEYVWLSLMIQYIWKSHGLSFIKDNAIKLYEKNVPCIAQIKRGFIKDDRTNHIFLKLFGTHKL